MAEPVVAIVGSRGFPDLGRVKRFVHQLAIKYPLAVVVSGGARDVDQAAEEAAKDCGLSCISYRPVEFEAMGGGRRYTIETVTCGDAAQRIVVAKSRRINPPVFRSWPRAAFHRNGWIVDDADHIVAYWDGKSNGTRDTITKARTAAEQMGKTLHVRLAD